MVVRNDHSDVLCLQLRIIQLLSLLKVRRNDVEIECAVVTSGTADCTDKWLLLQLLLMSVLMLFETKTFDDKNDGGPTKQSDAPNGVVDIDDNADADVAADDDDGRKSSTRNDKIE